MATVPQFSSGTLRTSALNTFVTEVTTNINNGNIAASAGIETSKLELATGSTTSPILGNAVALQSKNASGTAVDVLKLSSDNFLKLSQLPDRVEGSGGTFVTSTKTDVLICTGMVYANGNGANSVDVAVTLPVTMADTDYSVQFSCIGTKTTTPSGRADINGNAEIWMNTIKTGTKATTGFTLTMFRPSGNFTNVYLLTEFLVIGKKV